jgi:hypothetical protein
MRAMITKQPEQCQVLYGAKPGREPLGGVRLRKTGAWSFVTRVENGRRVVFERDSRSAGRGYAIGAGQRSSPAPAHDQHHERPGADKETNNL